MADFKFNDTIVTVGTVDGVMGYTHDSVEVTVTSSMTQGSLLKADGTEAAIADAADVVGAIDDLEFLRKVRSGDGQVASGSQVTVAVVKRAAILNDKGVKYSGGELIDTAGKAALGKDIKFTSIADDTLIK